MINALESSMAQVFLVTFPGFFTSFLILRYKFLLAASVNHKLPPEDGRTPAPEELNPAEQTSKKQVHPKDPSKTVNVSKSLTDA